MTNEVKKPVIVCTGETGRAVVFGWVEKDPEINKPVTIYNARMILFWPTACGGLFGLAANGVKDSLRLTAEVTIIQCMPKQWLAVGKVASRELKKWPAVK